MRRILGTLAILSSAACISSPAPAPRHGNLAIQTLLIDLNETNGLLGTTRYLVSYTSSEKGGRLQISGRRSGNRRLSADEVGRLGSLVQESGVLTMEYRSPTCDDCTVWELQVRLNSEVSGLVTFWQTEPHSPPSLIAAVQEAGR